MTVNKQLHLRNDVDRLYASRMEGGRGLIRCKMCVKAEENSLGWYLFIYLFIYLLYLTSITEH